MAVVLENQDLKVTIKASGAELTSIFNKRNDKEYLWQADEKVWPRHAPILFPVVGKLKEQKYKYQDSDFQLPQHGFARDYEFNVSDNTSLSARFILRSNESTLTNYPFKFELEVNYELKGPEVIITYTVINSGLEAMPFSIGAHPGFNCPIGENEKYEDYFFEFEKEENLSAYLLQEGLLTGATESLGKAVKTIKLTKELFAKDALVFKNLKSDTITLKSSKSTHAVALSSPGFPYMGLWTKPGTDQFVCIEPWYGVADNINASGNILEKEGINTLGQGEQFSCSYSIKIS